MKKIFLISIGTLMPALAAAHPSILPHDHPHDVSMLPDLAALLMAALAVGTGAIVIGIWKKAAK